MSSGGSTAALQERLRALNLDQMEYSMVLSTLKTLPADRPCHRLMGGQTLVQFTTQQVINQLEESLAGMEKAASSLREAILVTAAANQAQQQTE